jgi:hypothetical protein
MGQTDVATARNENNNYLPAVDTKMLKKNSSVHRPSGNAE